MIRSIADYELLPLNACEPHEIIDITLMRIPVNVQFMDMINDVEELESIVMIPQFAMDEIGKCRLNGYLTQSILFHEINWFFTNPNDAILFRLKWDSRVHSQGQLGFRSVNKTASS